MHTMKHMESDKEARFMEKAYLEGLAKALRISDEEREKLNQEAKALREELMS